MVRRPGLESHCLGAPQEEQELEGCPVLLVTQKMKGGNDRSTRRASVGIEEAKGYRPLQTDTGCVLGWSVLLLWITVIKFNAVVSSTYSWQSHSSARKLEPWFIFLTYKCICFLHFIQQSDSVVYACVHVCVCACVHACVHTCVCACMCVHVHVCAHMHTCVCLYSFPSGSVVKNAPANAGRRHGFDPWLRKIPWRRKWQLTSLFRNSIDRGDWWESMGSHIVGHDLATKKWKQHTCILFSIIGYYKIFITVPCAVQ